MLPKQHVATYKYYAYYLKTIKINTIIKKKKVCGLVALCISVQFEPIHFKWVESHWISPCTTLKSGLLLYCVIQCRQSVTCFWGVVNLRSQLQCILIIVLEANTEYEFPAPCSGVKFYFKYFDPNFPYSLGCCANNVKFGLDTKSHSFSVMK